MLENDSHRERCEPVPPEASMEFARGVKENHCYVCSDMVEVWRASALGSLGVLHCLFES